MLTEKEWNILRANCAGFSLCREMAYLPSIDSTNSEAWRRFRQGSPSGTVLLADTQTAGRGRQGRVFQSIAGKGLYMSVLYCPDCSPDDAASVTPRAALAVCRAVEKGMAIFPDIKWPNDILVDGKKLCGILTEAVAAHDTGRLWIVLGIGINIAQTEDDFGPELAETATSFQREGFEAKPLGLLTGVLTELEEYITALHYDHTVLSEYRRRCITPGKPVTVRRGDCVRSAYAIDIEDDFSLRVRYDDGIVENVFSGEVSLNNYEKHREG